jgi:hypothetical protein
MCPTYTSSAEVPHARVPEIHPCSTEAINYPAEKELRIQRLALECADYRKCGFQRGRIHQVEPVSYNEK